MILLAIDPSSSCTGAALFQDGKPIWYGFWRRSEAAGAGPWQWQLQKWLRDVLGNRVMGWPCADRRVVIEVYGPWDYFGKGKKKKVQTPRAWIESVGICRAVCFGYLGSPAHLAETDAGWLKRKDFAAEEVRLRVASAAAGTPVKNIDAATALLLGRYWLSGELVRDAEQARARKAFEQDKKRRERATDKVLTAVREPPALVPAARPRGSRKLWTRWRPKDGI